MINQTQIVCVAILLKFFGACMNTLFIIKVAIFLLINLSYVVSPHCNMCLFGV